MEPIYQILSVSHDGYDRMWYPFYFETNNYLTIINCKDSHESLSLQYLMKAMFSSKDSDAWAPFSPFFYSDSQTQCEIIFKSSTNDYRLIRRFCNSDSRSEVFIEKIGTKIHYHGENAHKFLKKFHTPTTIDRNTTNYKNCTIQRPYDEYSRRNMQERVQGWLRRLGINNGKVYLNPNGTWGFRNRENYIDNTEKVKVIMGLLSIFSQVIFKFSKVGFCSPIILRFDVYSFSRFEINSIINLLNSICEEHKLSAIIISNLGNYNINFDTISTPDTSLYD